jgi:hypothetical protein
MPAVGFLISTDVKENPVKLGLSSHGPFQLFLCHSLWCRVKVY